MGMTHGDLFSGIGGFALAARGAGLMAWWSGEIDEFCTKVYAKHFEGVRQYGKIEDIESIQKVDVITGGFPCQPVSLAGRRKGQDDERWLWPETQRIISLVGPRWVLLENVPGLLGRGMSDVLGGLSEIGYDAEWQVIPASALGAPHIRERVWIVCYPGGKRGTGREVFSKDFVEALAYADGVSGNVGRKRKGSGKDHARHAEGAQGKGPVHDGWDVEPNVDRVADGIPDRVDRLKSLGNAIVPQVAELILRRIVHESNQG